MRVGRAGDRKEISICLAGEKSVQADARSAVFNEKHTKGGKDRGDMRPRFAVETE